MPNKTSLPKNVHERIVVAVNLYEMGFISSDELRGEIDDILSCVPSTVSINEWKTLVFSAIPDSIPNMVVKAIRSRMEFRVIKFLAYIGDVSFRKSVKESESDSNSCDTIMIDPELEPILI